ncbi:thermonuclease family protein [Amorphus orientalis]|uniref:TNase-like domain-containing protein n=1 Tax=Amorphus orientalis TaxID=649198 RepID=A0AAE3VK46_9HYPH|nr:thermonuclease family protein [Amorphus orientalis]MDQ0313824.1 hypothetical protein [Amorphus orientalis]
MLVTASGLTLVPGGIFVPPAAEAALAARLSDLIGQTVGYEIYGHDRYGHALAQIFPSRSGDRSLSAEIVAAGQGAVLPDAIETPCLPELLRIEGEARAASRGLWGSVLRIRQAAEPKLATHAGTLGLIEGRVLSVGNTTTNHYLNFGRNWALDFTVMIPVRDAGSWGAGAPVPEELAGRKVRVRGLLEEWNGALIRAWHPAQIERIDDRD